MLVAPYDWVVSPTTAFQPDLLVARRTDLGVARLERAPLLVVEVLSASTRLTDLGTKRLAYESAGVGSYWLIDPEEARLRALRLEEGHYVEEAAVTAGEAFQASHPFPVTVVPSELVAGH